MGKPISVLCIHGVGHGDVNPDLESSWKTVISDGLSEYNPSLKDAVTCDFLKYDALFDKASINSFTYGNALKNLLSSGVVHSIGNLFKRDRGLFEIPDKIRWTAGMVAQWVSNEKLREDACNLVLAQMKLVNYDVVCAHSLGSLICYDTFLRNPMAINGKYFVSFGSQIGNLCVRDVFAGRLEPLTMATMWFHLFNPDDHVLTADISISANNFEEVGTKFDNPNDVLNHEATMYLNHQNTKMTVWRNISGAKVAKSFTLSKKTLRDSSTKSKHRALLVGINNYPDPANQLEGCVNDVFLMSSVLQECGFDPEDIRVVLNERATATEIQERLHWLLDNTKATDNRVLFYSGHGAQIPAYGVTDEVDHMDECLVPYDFDWTPQHAFTDKMFLKFYSQLPYDCHFTAIFDCCHSGGMTREGGRKIRGITPPDDIRHRALRWNPELKMWEERTFRSPNSTLMKDKNGENYLGVSGANYRIGRAVGLRNLPQEKYDAIRHTLKHNGPYLPVLLESCQEDQLSYEYRHGAQSYGAFTFSLAKTLREHHSKNRNPTFIQLMKDINTLLKQLKYEQTPNLIGAKKILHQPLPWKKRQPKRKITKVQRV